MKMIDIDTQQARHETRVVGTANTIYEYVVAAITAVTFVGQMAVSLGAVACAVSWALGLDIRLSLAAGVVVAAVAFTAGMGAFVGIMYRLRTAITKQERDKRGRFVPVYRNGKHEYDLESADYAGNERIDRWGGGG